ncbi:HemK2/MTQ2 family protein methyltransferase [Methanomethylovorans sp.]|uniref:HemK2/MTQ2 family protein methyltransferase n=1 Tax=Methanomethylovorans sp. TaxID=2758717 RepID=UPI000ADB60F5|nr:HemK2/MTQ2 family protein methyltransferase [Methanomethylovorans sp.]
MVSITYRKACVKLTDDVYEPAEDSFLLADATLGYAKEGMKVLEIGTGTGFISAVLQSNLDVDVLATDINPYAVRCACDNGVRTIRADMFSAFKPVQCFDMIVFNPPYLPTLEEDKVPGWLNYAFDGGVDGMRFICMFLENVPLHLRPNGIILLLVSSFTEIEKIKFLMEEAGFESQIVLKEKYFFEELMVFKGILKDKTEKMKSSGNIT